MKKKYTLLFMSLVLSVCYLNAQTLTASYLFNGNATDAVSSASGVVINATLTSDRKSQANSAYMFNGSAQIVIPTTGIMTNNYTYTAWVKLDATLSLGSKNCILSIGDSNNTADQALCIANGYSGQFGFGLTAYNTSSANDLYQGAYNITNGTWYFVTATKANDSIKVYVDGLPVLRKKFNGTAAGYGIAGKQKATIGCRTNGIHFFKGTIDDVNIYNDAMSETEVYTLHNNLVSSVQNPHSNHLRVYPNPVASGNLKIEGAEVKGVSLMTMDGRVVPATLMANNEIELSAVANGIYILQVNTAGGQQVQKIVVAR